MFNKPILCNVGHEKQKLLFCHLHLAKMMGLTEEPQRARLTLCQLCRRRQTHSVLTINIQTSNRAEGKQEALPPQSKLSVKGCTALYSCVQKCGVNLLSTHYNIHYSLFYTVNSSSKNFKQSLLMLLITPVLFLLFQNVYKALLEKTGLEKVSPRPHRIFVTYGL